MSTSIELPCVLESPTFSRYEPFEDGRTVIVRRGEEMGFQYGAPMGPRAVVVDGVECAMTRYHAILSPPPLGPGQSPVDSGHFKPESDVLMMPDAEILIPRVPNGFNDEEVEQIVAAIRFSA